MTATAVIASRFTKLLIESANAKLLVESSPDVGSSSMRIRGIVTISMATLTRLR